MLTGPSKSRTPLISHNRTAAGNSNHDARQARPTTGNSGNKNMYSFLIMIEVNVLLKFITIVHFFKVLLFSCGSNLSQWRSDCDLYYLQKSDQDKST